MVLFPPVALGVSFMLRFGPDFCKSHRPGWLQRQFSDLTALFQARTSCLLVWSRGLKGLACWSALICWPSAVLLPSVAVGGGGVGCVWEVTRIEMSDRFRVVGVTGRVFELLTQLT